MPTTRGARGRPGGTTRRRRHRGRLRGLGFGSPAPGRPRPASAPCRRRAPRPHRGRRAPQGAGALARAQDHIRRSVTAPAPVACGVPPGATRACGPRARAGPRGGGGLSGAWRTLRVPPSSRRWEAVPAPLRAPPVPGRALGCRRPFSPLTPKASRSGGGDSPDWAAGCGIVWPAPPATHCCSRTARRQGQLRASPPPGDSAWSPLARRRGASCPSGPWPSVCDGLAGLPLPTQPLVLGPRRQAGRGRRRGTRNRGRP